MARTENLPDYEGLDDIGFICSRPLTPEIEREISDYIREYKRKEAAKKSAVAARSTKANRQKATPRGQAKASRSR